MPHLASTSSPRPRPARFQFKVHRPLTGGPVFAAERTGAGILAFVGAIKKAFTDFIREQTFAIRNEKEVFYEAFERDFSEETFEYCLMRGTGC